MLHRKACDLVNHRLLFLVSTIQDGKYVLKCCAWHYSFIGSNELLQNFKLAVKRYNCKVFVIDNLMTTFYEGESGDQYRQQSLYIAELVNFAHQYNVHIHLVAHPRKVTGNVEKADVSGSGDITNRADNVFCISRIIKEDELGELRKYDNKLRIIKNREYGVEKVDIPLLFDTDSKRFYILPEEGSKQYSWKT
jgi:twinkle protein